MIALLRNGRAHVIYQTPRDAYQFYLLRPIFRSQLRTHEPYYGARYIAWVRLRDLTIDAFLRRIEGLASSSLRSDPALDVLNSALHSRARPCDLVHHSCRGVQYLSIRYTERLDEAEATPSAGSREDSYDNAFVKSS